MSLIRLAQNVLGRRGYGYRPDPVDERDSMLVARLDRLGASPEPPPSASVRSSQVQPKDQLSTESCTGQGTSQGLRLAYLKAGIECPDLSALFPYFLGRPVAKDEGAIIRDVIKAIVKWGEATEAAWPFKILAVNKHPNYGAYRSAYDRRGAKLYHRIASGDVVGVRRAIAAGYPVVAGWNLSRSFEDWNGNGVIDAQKLPYVGGHCMVITDYEADDTFGLLNSWGKWGQAGYARVTKKFVGQATDLWALEIQ